MVAIISKDDDPDFTSAPTGWTRIATGNTTTGNDLTTGVWYIVATSTETAASNFTWSFVDANEDGSGAIAAFIPGNSNPVHVQTSTHVLRSNDTTPASNNITATAGNLLVGTCGAAQADTGGLGVVATAVYTIPTNGSNTTGTGNGDNGSILAYDLDAAPGSQAFEADNAESTAESHPYLSEFSDDAAAATGTVMGSLIRIASGV
jgi:hypothetical protein